MNKAVSQLSINEETPSKQMAIIIPLHPAEKSLSRRPRKKKTAGKEEARDIVPGPAFTSPVFRPKKHDLL